MNDYDWNRIYGLLASCVNGVTVERHCDLRWGVWIGDTCIAIFEEPFAWLANDLRDRILKRAQDHQQERKERELIGSFTGRSYAAVSQKDK